MENVIGENIKQLRENKNLTMSQLSAISKVAQSSISLIENGKRIPNKKTLEKLAKALEVNVEELLNDNANEDNEKKRVIFGAEMSQIGKFTEVKISIDTKISEKAKKEIEDEQELIVLYAFESTIIVKTLTEFIKKHEDEIKNMIIENIKKEFE
jgi:transcriptional regulator with XRE-family HTH domain